MRNVICGGAGSGIEKVGKTKQTVKACFLRIDAL